MPLACIERCALLAWDPNYRETSHVACGSFAKNENDRQDSLIELFSLTEGVRNVEQSPVSSTFSKLLWTNVNRESSLIVGGFTDGSISVWNTHGQLSLQKTVPLYEESVGGLCQSSFQSNLLVSGAFFGQVHLWDLNKAEKQSELSFTVEKISKITDLAWNRKVPHIVAASSATGQVSILDLRSKKAVVNFSLPEGGSGVSSISWSPDSPTEIAVPSSCDGSPALYLWDLKNINSPQVTLTGHSSGILSTSWSSSALLSSSRDGSVLSWSPSSGEIIRKLEQRSETVFSVSWCPDDSDLFATCSLDGNVKVYSYQDTLSCHEEAKYSEPYVSDLPSQDSNQIIFDAPSKSEPGPPPIGAVFGPGAVCSVFRANRRDVAVVKIVSDDYKAAVDQIAAFENLLTSTGAGSVCKGLCDCESNSQIWKIVSLLFAQDFNAELLELIGASHHQYPTTQSSNEHPLAKRPFELHPSTESDLERAITEKLIAFDIRGAVSDCLSSNRYGDALILASCYGPELREEVESYILEHSTSAYMRIASALRFNDFSDLIDNFPLSDWKSLLSLIIHHAQPDSASVYFLRLAERLSAEPDAYLGAAVSFLLAGDLYKFSEKLLLVLFKDAQDNLSLDFDKLFDGYRLIRFLQLYYSEILNTITDESLKNLILNVILKVKYIHYLAGSESSSQSQDFTEFSAQFTGKDVNLDLMIAKLFSCNAAEDMPAEDSLHPTQAVPSMIDPSTSMYAQSAFTAAPAYAATESLTGPVVQPVYAELMSMYPAQSVQSAQPLVTQMTSTGPQINPPLQAIKRAHPISPSWSPEGSPKTYNDAPIIKPRGSALVPDISSQIASLGLSNNLDENDISQSINILSSNADQKAQGVQKKMVADWTSKLTAAIVCTGTYDPSTQSSIAALFKEISQYQWNLAADITNWLLTTHFSETKDWILNVKRLLEIAKN